MDAVERLLRARGIELVAAGSGADLHLVNTCTVTADRRRQVAQGRPAGAAGRPGCHAHRHRLLRGRGRRRVRRARPGRAARRQRGQGRPPRRGRAASRTARRPAGDGPHGPLDAPLPTLAGVEVAGIADGRARIDRTRAFVKVQDGCSFFCTYCIIPRARGPERSLAPEVVLADVRRGARRRPPRDRPDRHQRRHVRRRRFGARVPRQPRPGRARRSPDWSGASWPRRGVERIRLSSIEPQHVDDDAPRGLDGRRAGRCLPHFHLPLQSGDDGVLRRMGRRYDTAFYARTVARVRAAFPGAAIHADVIAGFPTEDDAAFARSLAFIRGLDPAGIHVFRYSARPGTPGDADGRPGPRPGPEGSARRSSSRSPRRAGGRSPRGRSARRGRCSSRSPTRPAAGSATRRITSSSGSCRATGTALEGEIAQVAVDAVDPLDPERVVGRVVALVARHGGTGGASAGRRPAGPGAPDRLGPCLPFDPAIPTPSIPLPRAGAPR